MKNASLFILVLITLSAKAQTDTASKLNPDSFENGISQTGIQVLDVRTSGEYTSGHIKNAMLADWTNKEQFTDRVQYLDKNKPVYVYCLVGGRSSAAAEWMRYHGFNSVIELEGGINAWKKASKPLEANTNVRQMTIAEYWATIPTDKTVLVDIGAPWCPPCVKMEPVLREIQKDVSLRFQFISVDAGIHTDVLKSLNIEPIPVFIVYKNGKEVWREQGIVSIEELRAILK